MQGALHCGSSKPHLVTMSWFSYDGPLRHTLLEEHIQCASQLHATCGFCDAAFFLLGLVLRDVLEPLF
jgi:hypothetical protein